MAKGDVLVRMKADVSNYDANIAKARRTLDGFKQDNMTLGGIINQSTRSLVAAAAQYASFAAVIGTVASGFTEVTSKGIDMAREAEGVSKAFERLNNPGLLDNLREATHNTVNDLELMKQAVKFDNFNLSLEQMGTFLAFAQQQAKNTGQDVGYLVDSIVTGLGRKSLPILDNLGLSATEIRERMKETGDMTKAVADIIQERMKNAGDYIETASDRAAQAQTRLENAMMELGNTFGPITESSDSLWNSIKVGAVNALSYVGNLINYLHEAGRISKTIGNMNGGGMMERFGNNLRNSKDPSTLYSRQLAAINRSINAAEAKLQQAEEGGMGSIQIYRERVQALKEVKKQYEDLYKTISSPVKNPLIASDTDKEKTKEGGGKSNKTKKTKTETVKTEEQLNNDEIQKLTQEYIKASNDRRKAIEGEIKTLQDRNAEIKRLMEAAQGKAAPDGSLKALSEELSKLQQERQLLSDPIDIELHDQAIKDVQDEIDRLNGKKVEVELAVDNRTPFEKLKDSLKIEIAEENMQVDTTTLQTLMKTAIQNGIDGLDPNFSALHEKMREGMNIPDSAWEDLQTQINEKLKELDIEPIKIDFKTGNLAKDGKETEKSWQAAAQAVQTVGSAMSSIEDPAAKIAGTVAQAIATIALGYANAMKTAGELGPVAWIAFAATGLATMLSTISSIHSATGYAEGGVIKGNSYSGDNIPIMANAGEVVLTKAMTNNLAAGIQSQGMGGWQLKTRLAGTDLLLSVERTLQKQGYGKIATWG